MDRKLDLKVGQEVAVKIEKGSNASRRISMIIKNIDDWCFDGIVTKVGRKFITVKFNKWKEDEFSTEEQFSIENDYRQKYTAGGADYKLYLNKQEVIDEYEAEDIYDTIKDAFGRYGGNNGKFTLDQLRRIEDIINEQIK